MNSRMQFLPLLSPSLLQRYVVTKFTPEILTTPQIKCVLHSLLINGNIQDLGRLSGSVDAREYKQFHDMVGQVFNDRQGGPILCDQLEKWAKKAR